MGYAEFLERKRQLGGEHGFEPLWMPDFLYPFQASMVGWALRKGRAAILADCGLGKSPNEWRRELARLYAAEYRARNSDPDAALIAACWAEADRRNAEVRWP